MPEARPGIVLPLTVIVTVDGRSEHRRRLWVFGEDPFAGERKSLEAMKITLFDPSKKTLRLFEKSKIPFTWTRNVDTLATLDQGTLVVGEGVSFRAYRSLPEMMVKAAARGVDVICLAPSDGSMLLPGAEGSKLPRPSALTLRRNDVIKQFDKRLDSAAWPADGKIVASNVRVSGDRRGGNRSRVGH